MSAGDIMIENINETVTICGTGIHIDSISTNMSAPNRKSYYQHRHPGIELHYIINGQCNVNINKNAYSIEPESMLLIPPGTYHDVSPTQENTARLCLSFSIKNKKDNSAHPNTATIYSTFNRSSPVMVSLRNTQSQLILNSIVMLMNKSNTDAFKTEKLIANFINLLLELIPHFAHAAACDKNETEISVQEDVSYKIDTFLGRNFMRNDAKSLMAEDLYISPRQLQRIIKKNYGMNYRQKLSETRIQIAMDLLYNSDKPIHEIAEILGYSCSANFSAFIKRATGKTPSQIRKER